MITSKHHQFFLWVITFIAILSSSCSQDHYIIMGKLNNGVTAISEKTQIIHEGLQVGYIGKIIIKDEIPIIEMHIFKNIEIPVNTTFSLLTSNLLGEKIIDLELSNNKINYKRLDTVLITEILPINQQDKFKMGIDSLNSLLS